MHWYKRLHFQISVLCTHFSTIWELCVFLECLILPSIWVNKIKINCKIKQFTKSWVADFKLNKSYYVKLKKKRFFLPIQLHSCSSMSIHKHWKEGGFIHHGDWYKECSTSSLLRAGALPQSCSESQFRRSRCPAGHQTTCEYPSYDEWRVFILILRLLILVHPWTAVEKWMDCWFRIYFFSVVKGQSRPLQAISYKRLSHPPPSRSC